MLVRNLIVAARSRNFWLCLLLLTITTHASVLGAADQQT